MAGEQVLIAAVGPDVFCGECHHAVAPDGVCRGCDSIPETTYEFKPAWALAPGTKLYGERGALLEVESVCVTESRDGTIGMRARKAIIGLKSAGAAWIAVPARYEFSVLREVG
jgi:hypothetical protein